jgi:c-di-GMP-binding flagellar brake protein YcgR
MRQFIRHPVDVPVEIGIAAADSPLAFRTHDISAGGLAFHSNVAIAPGVDVAIRIAYVQPAFEAHARVAWCHPHCESGFELGVTFLDADDAFRARMVEQVCHIEDYRMSVYRRDGRRLTAQEAATEWIEQYAAQFPAIGPDHVH